ncbi:peptidoglycan DD-metalloendopeptidase family protein, partial [candidate division KSB1 bacterium]
LLGQEKNEINNKLMEVNATINDLQNRIGYLYEKDDELRYMSAMELPDPSLREFGTGGAEDVSTFKSEFFFTEQELLQDQNPALEKLLAQVSMQEESFFAIQEGIESRKEWLRFYPGGYPVDGGRIRSGFGRRPDPFDSKHMEDHWGLDIGGLPVGTPVKTTADGRVVQVERRRTNSKEGLGLFVKIEHFSETEGWITLYGHLSEVDPNIRVGTEVKRGDVIGKLGDTGRATAAHLHYEIRQVDMLTGKESKMDPRIAHINPYAYRDMY